MKTEMIHTLTATFEAHAQQTEGGIEFWLARDLQHLLGYMKWDNFLNVVFKAKIACEVSGHIRCPIVFPTSVKRIAIGGCLKKRLLAEENETVTNGNGLERNRRTMKPVEHIIWPWSMHLPDVMYRKCCFAIRIHQETHRTSGVDTGEQG